MADSTNVYLEKYTIWFDNIFHHSYNNLKNTYKIRNKGNFFMYYHCIFTIYEYIFMKSY